MHTFLKEMNAFLAFDILAFISSSVPPSSSTMLPRYMKELTSSSSLSFALIDSLFDEHILSIFDFPGCILSPTDDESCSRMVVFDCSCC